MPAVTPEGPPTRRREPDEKGVPDSFPSHKYTYRDYPGKNDSQPDKVLPGQGFEAANYTRTPRLNKKRTSS